jgi:hypothetical protein
VLHHVSAKPRGVRCHALHACTHKDCL